MGVTAKLAYESPRDIMCWPISCSDKKSLDLGREIRNVNLGNAIRFVLRPIGPEARKEKTATRPLKADLRKTRKTTSMRYDQNLSVFL